MNSKGQDKVILKIFRSSDSQYGAEQQYDPTEAEWDPLAKSESLK